MEGISEELLILLRDVVDGKKTESELPFTPIRNVENILTKVLGFEELEMDGDETNGWQIDFWYTFEHLEKGMFLLSGSMHYGGMKFSKK